MSDEMNFESAAPARRGPARTDGARRRGLLGRLSDKLPRARRAASIVTSLAAGGLIAATCVAGPATAAGHSSTEATTARVAMKVVGFRPDVAAAHGYRIVTRADGSRASVPLTAHAKADQRAAASLSRSDGVATPDGVVDGDCGSSWINAVKQADDTVAYSTGYVVFGAVVDSSWTIVATGFVTGNSTTLSPPPNSGTWSAEGGIGGVVGPGVAGVSPFGSFAVLASGEVCYSGGPTATFG